MSHSHDKMKTPGRSGYEIRDVSPRGLLIAGGALALLIAGAFFIARFTYDYLKARQPMPEPVPAALRDGRQPGPLGPLLQINAPEDLRRFREAEDARLNGYGRDPLTGAIHIPIERAKQLVLAKGLPVRASLPPPMPAPPTEANPATRPAG
jgi:hypothetical protein